MPASPTARKLTWVWASTRRKPFCGQTPATEPLQVGATKADRRAVGMVSMLSFMSHLLRVGAGPGWPVEQVSGTVRRRGSGAQLIYRQLVEVVIFEHGGGVL